MILIFAFRQGLCGPNELNYVAKKASIPGPLGVIRKWAFLSYFDNQGEYKAFFPQGQKMAVLRAFPGWVGIPGREKEPDLGLFFRMSWTNSFSCFMIRGGFGNARLKDEITVRMRERYLGWEEKRRGWYANCNPHIVRSALATAGIFEYDLIEDETGYRVCFSKRG